MRYIATLLAGLVVGGLLTYYVIIRAPGWEKPPGEPSRGAPQAEAGSEGVATLVLDEQFFNTLLATIFRDLETPKFGDASAPPPGGCQGQVEIVEMGSSGARTGVRLQNDTIVAPLVFNGTFAPIPNLPCVNFSGTAEADITLSFDHEKQTLFGFLNTRTVNLDSLGPEYTPLATSLVQTAVNQKINPITILHGPQVTLAIPVQAANGTINARATEIRSEARNGRLRLYITYEFSGAKGTITTTPSPAN